MAEKWTGVFIGKCHNAGVNISEVAKKLGYTKSYVSMVLHGERNPKDAKITFNLALDEIIKEKAKVDAS